MTDIVIPAVGTEIPFDPATLQFAKGAKAKGGTPASDKGTPYIRIKSNPFGGWKPLVAGSKSGGLMLFLNDAPEATTTHIRVSSVVGSGKAVYGDPITK